MIDRIQLDQLCINTIRILSIDAVQKAQSGHPGTPHAQRFEEVSMDPIELSRSWNLSSTGGIK